MTNQNQKKVEYAIALNKNAANICAIVFTSHKIENSIRRKKTSKRKMKKKIYIEKKRCTCQRIFESYYL